LSRRAPGVSVARVADPYLRVLSGPAAGTTVTLAGVVVLGRAGTPALGEDAAAAPEHARVTASEDGTLALEDLGSQAGSLVNGERVASGALVPGDVVTIGGTDFRVYGAPASTLYDDEVIRPWYEHAVRVLARGAPLYDCHGHTGFNDPDGFTFSGEELVATLEEADARGVVMSMHEPELGYSQANDRVIAEAAASDGRLVALCRLDPKTDAVAEARRALEAGARGIKLHPRAEGFELHEGGVEPIFAFAHEQRLPILIHAGRGIPTLARDAVVLAERYPEARIILAHGAICDLNWLWRTLPRFPNLFIDTAWWNPDDLAALFALVPPGQLLFGSDLPYFTPFMSSTLAVRFGLQAGLGVDQLHGILGVQTARLMAGEEPLDLGPAPGPERLGYSVLLRRLTALLTLAVGRMLMGRTGYEPLALARLACDLGEHRSREAHVARNVLALLHAQEQFAKDHPGDGAPLGTGIRSIMVAACVSRTPDVPLPEIPELEEHVDLPLSDHADIRRLSAAGHRAFHETDLEHTAHATPDVRRSSAADHLLVDHAHDGHGR